MAEIITNGHRRPIIYGWELTEEERREFDWLDNCDTLSWDDAEFFRYKGWLYCLSDIMRVDKHSPFYPEWDGYESHDFAGGIVIKYPREDWGIEDTEHVIVGCYYS
jgi:hypothetical protein